MLMGPCNSCSLIVPSKMWIYAFAEGIYDSLIYRNAQQIFTSREYNGEHNAEEEYGQHIVACGHCNDDGVDIFIETEFFGFQPHHDIHDDIR